ncbi:MULTISPECIES: bifunctional 3-(3-hydroxy-phenyl)propionate/3-hydroxycinnamic acid hydroxylase [unclassified Pseudomonas]|jgi:3-(3-hydroxy-phenyl)propionate hydroxylase|uniref:3-(3-hydroxyphenyl)propionate hydroxylase n=1 Tax=Pseudomonas gorinensis TaxID=3240790 RepID=A0ACA7PA01_9PSED|nr:MULTISPECIES: bifunctional 3-(3-hydroxy-phenyl)propionate/3-hydroxycinnamic acid hydroxylase [unclassified Pseudomonas]AHC36813.1 3-(3-hydroxyphenyl)propionate hydroxylase [Pseudomonas sp. TKP]MBL1309802.1 bifunctional 3-(3-hydroxy-phenyl)propionate/3-hydroxycinnamic acid hydroxylase [Pseudomonas sp.]PMX17063.1 3-(3-hydroxyphenyl)propionate hydroxylase [Pseudomonas sp. MPBC4-3]PMX46119.1 3-(3-hydroxyphenyl)propionate hydroxylase [Pseudomonas sp. FW301-21B01]PMY06767.1 3-(3-hydroxyphenyl)pro
MTTLNSFSTQVLIVGAGPTGLTLANLLGQANVDTLIVDRKPGTVTEPRAVSIDDESLRTMQAIGLDDAVLRDVVPGYGVHYFTRAGGRCFGKVEPTGRLYGFPKRNAFRQPLFESTLKVGLERFANLTARFNHELLEFTQDQHGVRALIKDADGQLLDVKASYLIACDGGRSPVRKQLGIEMVGSSFSSRWLVVDTDQDDDPFWQTRVYCDARRPVVEVPGPHHTRRFEFQLKSGETDAQVLSPECLHTLLRPFKGDAPVSIVRKTVYTFHARVAERWQVGRVFLAGDAAHLTPPYAGQGMNSGVRDAHNLGWKLIAVLKGQMAATALLSYESERRDHAWALIKLALNLGVVMAPATVLRARLISAAFALIGLVPPLRDYFLQMRFKPKPRFTKGLVLPEGKAGKLACGQMFPQPLLTDAQGHTQLLDTTIGAGFALIQYGDPALQRLDELRHGLWDHLEAKRILILPAHVQALPSLPGCTVLHDREDALKDLLGDSHTFVLLRPDRYVAAIFDLATQDQAAGALQSLFGITLTNHRVDQPAMAPVYP